MSNERSECDRCGGIIPVPVGESAPAHKDYSRNEDPCKGTGQPTKRM